jgi:hypothetical protein
MSEVHFSVATSLLLKLPYLERNLLNSIITNNVKNTSESVLAFHRQILAENNTTKIVQLLAKLSVDIGLHIFDQIFSVMPTDTAKQSIKQNPYFNANHSFTYGDIEFSSFANILQRCNPKKGDVFVDLGHGTGRALVTASIMYSTVLSKIHGIELLIELVDISRDRVSAYNTLMRSPPYATMFGVSDREESSSLETTELSTVDKHCEITLEEGDILAEDNSTYDWTQAGIYSIDVCL